MRRACWAFGLSRSPSGLTTSYRYSWPRPPPGPALDPDLHLEGGDTSRNGDANRGTHASEACGARHLGARTLGSSPPRPPRLQGARWGGDHAHRRAGRVERRARLVLLEELGAPVAIALEPRLHAVRCGRTALGLNAIDLQVGDRLRPGPNRHREGEIVQQPNDSSTTPLFTMEHTTEDCGEAFGFGLGEGDVALQPPKVRDRPILAVEAQDRLHELLAVLAAHAFEVEEQPVVALHDGQVVEQELLSAVELADDRLVAWSFAGEPARPSHAKALPTALPAATVTVVEMLSESRKRRRSSLVGHAQADHEAVRVDLPVFQHAISTVAGCWRKSNPVDRHGGDGRRGDGAACWLCSESTLGTLEGELKVGSREVFLPYKLVSSPHWRF